MWMKWFPWRWMVSQWAKGQGFFDPIKTLAQFQQFAQPSEVTVPVEIVRLAVSLHARGLMNSQAIQHNLDWVWPFWVERQFDPHDPAFIPRAFSLSHINLTHRNWTAVGIPDCPDFPIVDPAGLVTPFLDSWSIDTWIIPEQGAPLIPSRLKEGLSQKLLVKGNLGVLTESHAGNLHLISCVQVTGEASFPVCKIRVKAVSDQKAWCAISLRPYNPEGVNFIHQIEALAGHHGWKVNGKDFVYLNQTPDRCAYSDYRSGDVYHFLPHIHHRQKIVCDVGMATAACLYALSPGIPREIEVAIPLQSKNGEKYPAVKPLEEEDHWAEFLKPACRLKIPDPQFQYLYDAAVRTLILHSPKDVYPGPYTYKHFWFRDAAFILNAMLCLGLPDRVKRVIRSAFFSRQTPFGYFHSQDGEWDSNGQVLWTLAQFCRLTGTQLPQAWQDAVQKGAKWIERKRLPENLPGAHAGLLPPGFSAEHLGPNDYYYWDDFWGVAGLKAASSLMHLSGNAKLGDQFEQSARQFNESIERSLEKVGKRLGHKALPASPYRRMDTGAIGSITVGYPLQLWDSQDPRLLETVEYLMRECSVDGGFFHDMSHSGINPYLTLHIAQVLLRAGDSRYYQVMKAVADLASPTGQWPEAIHPVTKGGCMGDGQHVWAAAEWILMIRNCFIREEEDALILFSGIPYGWLESKEAISFGPAPTKFGPVSLSLKPGKEKIKLVWDGRWFGSRPPIEILLPGHGKIMTEANQNEVEVSLAVQK